MKYIVLSIISGGILAIVGIGFYRTLTEGDGKNAAVAPQQEVHADAIITYGPDGSFSPAEVTIATGQTVAIKNGYTDFLRAVSNPHPTHQITPDFDSDDLEPGEHYVYTAKKVGKIGYHNHYQPGALGTIIVR